MKPLGHMTVDRAEKSWLFLRCQLERLRVQVWPNWPARRVHIYIYVHFLGSHLRHMEISRLRVESEQQLPAFTTAIAMQDPSHVCGLHHSSRQCRILNPLKEARNRTHILQILVRFITIEPQQELQRVHIERGVQDTQFDQVPLPTLAGKLSWAVGKSTQDSVSLSLIKGGLGMPLWLSELRTRCCHYCSLGCCCGSGSVPGPETSTCCGHSQKKPPKNRDIPLHNHSTLSKSRNQHYNNIIIWSIDLLLI